MQKANFKDKCRGEPGNSKDTGDPEYENITLTFRERDQPKGSHPGPMKCAPAQPKSPSGSAQVPAWLQRSIMSLYVLLALMFLFCIILSALVLVKNTEMSREMLHLRRELSNVSNSALECQEEQRNGWSKVHSDIEKATNSITKALNPIDTKNQQVLTEITKITQKIQKIHEALEKKTNAAPASK
ncbi:mast cell-expressed membrane protein 1 [Cavia porcellus]|uniref:Mast cell expressed membrane protein 1 n=1 Tax=Cavia porcellus TaxID=10141 RepID=A0A286Y344_CAVPO|nr:mast cell-expressed membrane protein 1 [Cavia porcellus]